LSALLGTLYRVDEGQARAKAFSRYYAAIQVGSMPSTLVGGYLHYRYGWGVAFGACVAALAIALAVIGWHWPKLQPLRESLAEAVIDGAIAQPQWRRLAVLCIGAAVFFAGFQQQQTTLVLWARDVCRVALPESVSTLNPFFALFLLASPLAGWAHLRGRLSVGLLALAAGFVLLLCGDGIGWLVGWYLLATVGEVLVSPLGLNMACSLVPRRLAATATALWLLSMAIGGKLAGVLGAAELRIAVSLSIALSLAGALWFWLYAEKRSNRLERKEALCQN
jgi:POT family proton-dependent oligopeptide transporter